MLPKDLRPIYNQIIIVILYLLQNQNMPIEYFEEVANSQNKRRED